ncbi:MAG: hypothetical protein ACREEM_08015, partial [Blastocatellia bacterium]
ALPFSKEHCVNMKKTSQGHILAFFISVAFTLLISAIAVIQRKAVSAQAQTVEPRWTSTGPPTYLHTTLTRLHNGRVIAVGGRDPLEPSPQIQAGNKVEIYEPLTGRWRAATPLNIARYDPTAVLLADGRLLTIGGWKFLGPGIPPALAGPPEIFDPATETWSVVTPSGLTNNFFYRLFPNKPTTTTLPNGEILFLGSPGNAAMLFDPASNVFEDVPDPASEPSVHSTVLLPNGKVLYLTMRRDGNKFSVGAELFDVATRTWSATAIPAVNGGAIVQGRLAGLLPDGKVLGVFNSVTTTTPEPMRLPQSSALYDPQTGIWTDFVSRRSATDFLPESVVLASGDVVTLSENEVPELYRSSQKSWHELFPAISPKLPPLLLADGRAFTGKELFGFDFGSTPAANVVNASAASFRVESLAKDSIATAFGTNLSDSTSPGSDRVSIRDQQGAQYDATVFAVTPNQINYRVPLQLAEGQAEVIIRKSSNGEVSRGLISIVRVSPGVFSANANGRGVPAAVVLRIKPDGSQSYEPVAEFDAAQNRFVSRPIDLGVEGEQVFLSVFGSGFRNRSALENVQVYFGDAKAEALYAGAQPDFAGLDQINARIPRSLAGRGEIDLYVTVDGKIANPVKLQFK